VGRVVRGRLRHRRRLLGEPLAAAPGTLSNVSTSVPVSAPPARGARRSDRQSSP
jgi:hypothetical protein